MKRDLTKLEGTIANVLSENYEKIEFIDNVNDLKNEVIKIVNESNVSENTKNKFNKIIYGIKNYSQLLSTIGTYMIGEKVI